MNVGVYFPGFSQQTGGGYTFEHQILEALMKLSPESHHHFILFFKVNSTSYHPTIHTSKNLRTIFLEQPGRANKMQTFLSKVSRKLGWKTNVKAESILQKAAQRENIEIIWFPTPIYDSVEIPYVATVWDIQHRIQPWFPEVSSKGIWAARESFYSTHLRRATFIITGNETGKKELSFFYQIPSERFRLISHPTPEIEHFPSDEEVSTVLSKYSIPPGYLFYPAQFWAHKNHANLLIALQVLRDMHKMDLHLVLTGHDHGNLQYIRNLAEQLGLKDQVHFLGFIARKELIALYKGAFSLVYVTLFGPENLPPLEAFACGCPVIASKVAGAEEQLGDAALLVDAYKPEKIALAVRELHSDPHLRESLISKGQRRAAKFTGIDFVRAVFGLLDDFEPVRRTWAQ